MKVYVITNEDWLIVESCLDELIWATEITCTIEQFDFINKQYDTTIVNGKITTQIKWENAINLEISKETPLPLAEEAQPTT